MIEPKDMERYARELFAMVDKAGRDDPEAFAQIVGLVDNVLPGLLKAAAHRLRTNTPAVGKRYSWADLGAALGVSRSAAQQRFGS